MGQGAGKDEEASSVREMSETPTEPTHVSVAGCTRVEDHPRERPRDRRSNYVNAAESKCAHKEASCIRNGYHQNTWGHAVRKESPASQQNWPGRKGKPKANARED